ncbi:Ornithine carbamoyltransferase chain F [Candidatus Annandia adelgestsuga]|uniref:Ornithine carbamoyltransferase n=1 Tax=Candidatus Annandia adelgestsuga TaxID=1302411 RepID=A0A3S9J7T5_9ENTR|nr:ornithine carbamoyltransferase [Candidatus Annandia adelgestsuga]AZP36309.1 Ornithine carbamoyltransferase chain F [Candidatus Annandia adelgestsuga]
MKTIYKKDFLRLFDFTAQEIIYLIELAILLKKKKYKNKENKVLKNKNIVLIFEKESTRTRCSFEVAAYDQGAFVTNLNYKNSQIGYKESIKDTARVLDKIYDGIQYRGFDQSVINKLAYYSRVPVWNGLTNQFHPTQLLADLMTIKENMPLNKYFNEIIISYIGDTKNNISNSLLEAAAIFGFDLRLISPKKYYPEKKFFNICKEISESNGGKIIVTDNIKLGVKDSDFLYTDVWLSMGESSKKWKERVSILKTYQVNTLMLKNSFNPKIKFLHCLPSFHNEDSILGKEIIKNHKLSSKGIEVTNNIFESNNSLVFKQSENRLHTIKSLLISTLYKNNNILEYKKLYE